MPIRRTKILLYFSVSDTEFKSKVNIGVAKMLYLTIKAVALSFLTINLLFVVDDIWGLNTSGTSIQTKLRKPW